MYIRVVVQPGAKKDKIEKVSADHYVVAVKEKPERNAANKRMLELLADSLGVQSGSLRIVIGHHSHNKIISVDI